MKVLFKQNPRDFPKPTHFLKPSKMESWRYRVLFFSILSVQSFLLSAQWVTYIDCDCDMNPYISMVENSGTETDGILCDGETATLSAHGGFTYKWSTGETTNTITVDKGGGYGVTVTDATGCIAVENVLITEHSKPLLLYDEIVCKGSETGIRVNGNNLTYNWSTGGTNSYLNITSGGTYSVTITDPYGCAHTQSATISLSLIHI